jgi:hypothetical protein
VRRKKPSSECKTSHDRVLTLYPRLLDTFVSFGFTSLRNPILRKTVARRVSIAQACRMMDVDVNKLLQALNGESGRVSDQSLNSEPDASG